MNRLIQIARNTTCLQTIKNINLFCCRRFSNIPRQPASPPVKQLLKVKPIRNTVVRSYETSGNDRKVVGHWLMGCGGMVFCAVILGGVTRLTESGLSMVTWKLLGEKIPRSSAEWKEEFAKYQQYPEFKMKNPNMTLEEFKMIFWMEYIHRMWGRAIGAVFLIPAIYFWTRGYFSRGTKKAVVLLGALLGSQGLMGWYMVKSGLEDRFKDVNDVPRVSQYRLALHLGVAFFLYLFFFSRGLRILLPPEEFCASTMQIYHFRRLAYVTKGFVFLTAVSGAFVAGLDAGLVYNSFPKMGDKWVPEDILTLMPVSKNFTENPTTVQFNHRILGLTTLSVVSLLWLLSRRTPLPRRAQWAVNSAALIAWAQVTAGVLTLLYYVPVHLAATHQSGSLLLLSFAMWLCHELRALKYVPK